MMTAAKVRFGDYLFLSIALAGCSAQANSRYGTARISIPDNRLECYFHELVNGGTVIDKRPAFERSMDDGITGVYSGPMVDITLEPGMVSVLLNGVKPASEVDKIGGLDHVALDIYTEYWRNLGARIGKRQDDVIVWEDGAIDPIVVPTWYRG